MLLETWQALVARWDRAFIQGRVHQRAVALALGLLCGVGRRTITRALGFLDKEQQDWSADYRLFSRSPWETVQLFEPQLKQAVETYCPADEPMAAALDDTVVPRNGKLVPNTSWQRDPMSPPFQVNLIWGQRYLQASLLLPLYRQDQESSPRALPVRFAECPVVRKPGKQASPQQWADYRQAKKQHNLSAQFVKVGQELRQRLDAQGYVARRRLLTGDNSFCNRRTFRQQWDRTCLLCRARKDLRLCFRHKGPGRRYYGQEKFTPQQVYANRRRQWKQTRIFHGGRWRQVRYKEVKKVLWQGGAGRKELRLLVLAPTPYLKTKAGHKYYRERAFLLTDDLQTETRVLLQDYFNHFEIEFNHRDEKDLLGVGQAQVWAQKSVPRVPEFVVASYSALLLASLQAYGPKRTGDYRLLPKWRQGRPPRRPSCQDLVTLLRRQVDAANQKGRQGQRPAVEQMILSAAA
jgi:hypothetical protein